MITVGKYEPIRNWLYGIVGPAVALLAGYGVVADEKAALWVALGAVVLVPTAGEVARSKTSSKQWLSEQPTTEP